MAVTNRRACSGDFLEQVAKIAAAQPRAIILREKDLDEKQYYLLALSCLKICREHNTPLIANTFWRAAKELGFAGIQLSLADFLQYGGDIAVFSETGVSVHSVTEAVAAEKAGAAYLIAGHIFPTECKNGLKPRGLSFLKETSRTVKIPVWAIGGITPGNYSSVISSGATGACIMSSLMKAAEPASMLAYFASHR